MDLSLRKDPSNGREVRSGQTDCTYLQATISAQAKEIENLKENLQEKSQKLLLQETENESLRRQIERSETENELLLKKLDSACKSVMIYEENENVIRNELQVLKEQNKNLRDSAVESNKARDSVIRKLKDVSLETRELIDNCEKATEETKLFRIRAEQLDEKLSILKQQNVSLQTENKNLQSQLEKCTVEILSLQNKLSFCNSEGSIYVNDLWQNDVLIANNKLREIEQQIKRIIENLNHSEIEKRRLREEIEHLKYNNNYLRNQNVMKDDIIKKQNQDFFKVKSVVDEYHSEILRLDSELKDCHERVSTLNKNLEMINSDKLDIAEFAYFKRLILKFGNRETLESLFLKLQVLYEIEQFFDKNVSPHLEALGCNIHETESLPSKEDAINKIKNYLEKAFAIIENLNDKMVRLRAEYESKLSVKNAEVLTLREVISNTTLYNKILEQTLQYHKNNVQLDQTIDSDTDKLLIANETLLDGFETIKHLYRISQQYVSFLTAKTKQLKLFYNLLKILISKECDDKCEMFSELESEQNIHRKTKKILFLMGEIFEEMIDNESRSQRLLNSQELVDKCDVNIIVKDNLKNIVEKMSQEVKRLTNKVEHEIAEKMREIESLKNEMENIKTDNRELVSKIKNCNREIISLSTENYDLNEKLECLMKTENQHDISENKLQLQNFNEEMFINTLNAKKIEACSNQTVIQGLQDTSQLCLLIKTENTMLKQTVITFSEEFISALQQSKEHLQYLVKSRETEKRVIVDLQKTCSDLGTTQNNLKYFVLDFQQTVLHSLLALKESLSCRNFLVAEKNSEVDLKSLMITCSNIRKSNEELKENVMSSTKAMSVMLPHLHSVAEKTIRDLCSLVKEHEDGKSKITRGVTDMLSILRDINKSLREFRSVFEDLKAELSNNLQLVATEVQGAISCTFENMKSSFALSNEEMIKEMQEMNLELKTRGALISDLTQTLSDVEKEKNGLIEKLRDTILKLMEQVTSYEKSSKDKDASLESLKEELENVKIIYENELKLKKTEVENLATELENQRSQIHLKDETIMSLKNEIAKQREISDGDVSSVGTVSKAEEISRLNDVEDSFEERYMKLRVIAVKMKKNIADLNQQLKTEKTEKLTLQSKLSVASEHAKKIQALQEECDKMTDELEIKLGEIKELKKIIRESDENNENLKLQCSEIKKNLASSEKMIDLLQNDKIELEKKLKILAEDLEKIRQEKLAEEILKKERDKEIQQLKQKLQENENAKQKVQNDLEEAKLEVRKQGALSLEMKDYEKTISELSSKIKEKENRIHEISQQLNDINDSNLSLITRIKQLEDQVASYVISSKAADEQILNLNKSLNKCESDLEERNQRLKQTIQAFEVEKSQHEQLTIQNTNTTSELKSLKESFHHKELFLNEQVKSLQMTIVNLEDVLKKKESEFNQMKDDFEAYKVRARNVLQKRKTEYNAKNNEEKLQSEIDALGQTIKELRKRLEDSQIEMDHQKAELEFMAESKEKLQKKVKELSEVAAEKVNELEAIRAEHKAYKLNTDTLVSCFKNETEKLKCQIEELKLENQKLHEVERSLPPTEKITTVNDDQISCSENEVSCSLPNDDHDSELEDIDEAKTYGQIKRHFLVPLDKLLETDRVRNESVIYSTDENELRQNIKTLEEQVKYLTRLLNESEKSSARNEQQVALFKEEIRRLQRMFEREPHLQNTEYLKNVVLKFLTLPLGDEKYRLVTVLETILKLTPSERETLSAVAKGYRPDQKQTGGWSSFLGWS